VVPGTIDIKLAVIGMSAMLTKNNTIGTIHNDSSMIITMTRLAKGRFMIEYHSEEWPQDLLSWKVKRVQHDGNKEEIVLKGVDVRVANGESHVTMTVKHRDVGSIAIKML